MKLTPEEIRERVDHIAYKIDYHDVIKVEILKLVEEVAGQKLPEPFESFIKNGSVWKNSVATVVLIKDDTSKDEFCAIALSFIDDKSGRRFASWEKTVEGIAPFLKRLQFRYLGQYDFAAGLPK